MPALDGNSRPHEEARLGHFLEPCCYGQVRGKFSPGEKYSGLGEGIPDRCSEGRVSSRA